MTLCWVWNSLLPDFYHLLVQVSHPKSLFSPFWHQSKWLNTDLWPKNTLDFQKTLHIFCILAYFWPNNWYLEERKGFLQVLLVPTNDNNQVIVNSRPNHWVKLQEMCENYFLKGKNGQFYSIKWLKYRFSLNRLHELFFFYIHDLAHHMR